MKASADEDCPPAPPIDGALVRELPIVNRKGLHARASARLYSLGRSDLDTARSWAARSSARYHVETDLWTSAG